MYLKKISLLNFKNIGQEELVFCPGINCLVGDNGAGKTNVVDAVHYLSMCKSSLGTTDSQSIRHGAEFFLAEGLYATDTGKSEMIVCSFSRKGGKVLKRNGKEYDRIADHVGLIPAVIVSPADSSLISDAADERRRYLNAFISQLDRTYLSDVMRYNTVLAQRNRLLKNRPDETMLSIYDQQLTEHGERIHARRREFARRLQPVVTEVYRTLSGDREQVELHYKSELNERPFEAVLRDARQKDLVNEFTTAGIHRDDLVLRIGGYPLRKYGSQGQQKSFLIALKLAQYAIVAAEKEEKPILLLDDLFDKLDAGRVEQLIRLVSDEGFGQIFITDCSTTRLRTILDRAGSTYTLFTVSNGKVRRESATGEPGSLVPESAPERTEKVVSGTDPASDAPRESAEPSAPGYPTEYEAESESAPAQNALQPCGANPICETEHEADCKPASAQNAIHHSGDNPVCVTEHEADCKPASAQNAIHHSGDNPICEAEHEDENSSVRERSVSHKIDSDKASGQTDRTDRPAPESYPETNPVFPVSPTGKAASEPTHPSDNRLPEPIDPDRTEDGGGVGTLSPSR